MSRRLRLPAALAIPLLLAGASAGGGEAPPTLRTASLGGLLPSSASLLMVEAEGGDLTVAVFATPLGVGYGVTHTLVVVEVAGGELLADVQGEEIRVELLIYALRPDGEVVASLLEGTRLDLGAVRETLERGGLKLTASVDLPPGEISLRALVHNRTSGAFGLGRAGLELPAEAPEQPRLLAPVFGESSRSWLPLEPASARARAQPGLLTALLSGTGDRVAAHPVLIDGRDLEATALLRGLEDREVELAARLQSLDGGEPGRAAVEVRERLAAPHLGGELLRLGLRVEGAPTGYQDLRIAAREPSTEELLQAPPVRVLTLSEQVELAHVAWPEFGTLVQPGTQLSLAELVPFDPVLLEQGDLASIRRQDIRAAYCEGLHQLSTGSRGVALARVQLLESEVVHNNSRLRAFRVLADVQSAVLFDLIRRERRAALPIILLHLDLFEDYLRHDMALALHAENTLRRLVASTLRLEADEERERAAARVLASVAGLRLQQSAVGSAIERFEEALRYDPTNAVAWLAVGTAYERLGKNRDAVAAFRKLLDEHPGHGEARLRLAVNLTRSGHNREARYHLRGVIESDAAEWVRAVAYQELGRSLERLGREEEAVAVVEEGLRRFPREQALRLQLAHLAEARGERRRATRLLEELIEGTETSAWQNSRYRYNLWPVQELREQRRQLREDSLVQLSRLTWLLGTDWGRRQCPG